jgi:molecular chaperone Hsp33
MNILLPFQFHQLPVRGRLLRLSGLNTAIPSLADTNACTQTLTELLAAAAMMAYDTKHTLNVGLQIQHPSLGALLFAQANQHNGTATELRAYANPAARGTPFQSLTSQEGGMFVVTLENTAITAASQMDNRYQSFIPLTQPSAAACLEEYFANSVQTPTHLAVWAGQGAWAGHAAALMLQSLPNEPLPADDWQRLKLLLSTIQTYEIMKENQEILLAKVFAEDDISLFPAEHPVLAQPDPRARMLAALAALPAAELAEIRQQPTITLTDDTTGVSITFTAEELAHLHENAEIIQ